MRALPALALLLAVGAAAQPTVYDLDRRVTTLERTVATFGTYGGGSADALAAERSELVAAIGAYRAEAAAYALEAARVRDEYDRLLQLGGTARDLAAYDAARFRLEDEGQRLVGEAAMLNEWTAELNARYRALPQRRVPARLRHRDRM